VKYSSEEEQQLFLKILDPRVSDDPYGFVMFNFPWGVDNTPLANHDGPRKWQRAQLLQIRDTIYENRERINQGQEPAMLKDATSSGRGIGKSTMVAWLSLWNMSCNIGSTTIVTANTETQLKTRTWAELGKWHSLAINGHWFDRSALSLRPTKWFAELVKDQLSIDSGYYYSQAQLWSEDSPDSFAGVHNPHGLLLIFDESSNIPKPIWTVSEGFYTEPVLHRYWLTYSNPRRNTGSFFECFHLQRDIWVHRNIDSRTVEGTDKKVLNDIIKTYGLDSDEARVEVLGQFPNESESQFIARDLVQRAQQRELNVDEASPLIMGVDVARKGRNAGIVRFRRGRDARSYPRMRIKGKDNMQFAYRVAELIDKYEPDAVCIGTGNGTGVIDRLRELRYRIVEVAFGGSSTRRDCHNKRASMWADARDWLDHGCIDESQELADDLIGPMYTFAGPDGDQYLLEAKEHMEKRGLSSPDDGDAFALCFAVKVAARNIPSLSFRPPVVVARDIDYSVLT